MTNFFSSINELERAAPCSPPDFILQSGDGRPESRVADPDVFVGSGSVFHKRSDPELFLEKRTDPVPF